MKRLPVVLIVLLVVIPGCGGDDGSGANLFFGKELYELTTNGGLTPCWSPDGNRIVYSANNDIWIISADGGEPTRLTQLPGQEFRPYWHPAPGNPNIVFYYKSGDESTIMTMNVDTGEQKELFSTVASIDSPCFTNDGQRIVFCGVTKRYGIRHIAADGSETEPVEMQNDDGWDTVRSVRCSPLEAKLLYVERRDLDYNIYTITIGSSKPTALTTFKDLPSDKHQIWYADWSKDAGRVVFSHSANIGTGGRSAAIYTMDSDGQNITGWTMDPATIHEDTILFDMPSFAPDNNRLACQHANNVWILVLE